MAQVGVKFSGAVKVGGRLDFVADLPVGNSPAVVSRGIVMVQGNGLAEVSNGPVMVRRLGNSLLFKGQGPPLAALRWPAARNKFLMKFTIYPNPPRICC